MKTPTIPMREASFGAVREVVVKKVLIDPEKCTNCEKCQAVCPVEAIHTIDYKGRKVSVILHHCLNDGACLNTCEEEALGVYELASHHVD